MTAKKIATILNLIEIADNNLKTAKSLLTQLSTGERSTSVSRSVSTAPSNYSSMDEENALEVVEGYFDGENMIGDNGQLYVVPPNYASKTQLVVGDRMKWLMTPDRDIFKLIQPVPRERVTGTFTIEGDSYLVIVNKFQNPIQILKASATYAMKNLGMQIGDEVAITVPKDTTATWGAFNSVVKISNQEEDPDDYMQPIDRSDEFVEATQINDQEDYF
jgi:hypothetical protein